MSAHRRRRIDRDTAELLLREAAAGRRTGTDPLLDVLVATSVRAADDLPGGGILAGEQDAVDAFRAARGRDVPSPGKKSAIKVAVASLLTWKALAAAGITASAIGGAAFIGGAQDPIPTPQETRPYAHGPTTTLGNGHPTTGPRSAQESAAASDGSAAATAPGTEPSAHSASSSAKASAGTSAGRSSSAAPSSTYVGLCRAYEARGGSSHERLQNPAFTNLVQAAGGEQEVDTYCSKLLGTDGASDRETSNDWATTPPNTAKPPALGNSQTDPGAGQPAPAGKPDMPAGR